MDFFLHYSRLLFCHTHYKLEINQNKLNLNDRLIDKKELFNIFKKFENHLISEYLIQADYANKIYSGSVNTIRVLTMRHPATKEVFIATAVHKFGSKKTGPADNVWRGGLTSLVNLETGILQKPALHQEKNKKIEWSSVHPDTREKIEGIQIPNWQKVKDTIISLTEDLNFLHYVGWDVVITNDGIRVIEGNSQSDVNLLQIHTPLLENEQVRMFYKSHGIIK